MSSDNERKEQDGDEIRHLQRGVMHTRRVEIEEDGTILLESKPLESYLHGLPRECSQVRRFARKLQDVLRKQVEEVSRE